MYSLGMSEIYYFNNEEEDDSQNFTMTYNSNKIEESNQNSIYFQNLKNST